MRATVILGSMLTIGLLGSTPARAQDAPAAAPEAPPPASPLSMPAMSGSTLVANSKPMKFDAGPLGSVYATGVLGVMAQCQNNLIPPDERRSELDLTNGQVFVQKVDGPVQFFAQGGAYSIPDIGVPYVRAGTTTSALFGGLPAWFLKFAPNDAFSLQAGNLPTLVGVEYTFSFENVNVQRGLLWNQENAINRGVQANYTSGQLALSLAWTDGFFSNRYNWLWGSATYTLDSSNSATFVGGGSMRTETVSSYATPLLQNNQTIYNAYFSHTTGPWTIIPALQYTNVPADPAIGIAHDLHTLGGAIYGIYAVGGGVTVAGRAEYIDSNGSAGDPTVLYGPGSKAWSLTVTPTYQSGRFYARGELSHVKATGTTAGMAFGPAGTNTSQTRALIETGLMF